MLLFVKNDTILIIGLKYYWDKKDVAFMKGKRIIIFSIIIVVFTMFVFPLFLHISFVKQMINALLSFSNNPDYKVAYVEFFGAIIGSFMAICGSVWIQSQVDERQEIDRRKKYACIVFNDLDLAFKDLIKLVDETDKQYDQTNRNNEDYKVLFSEISIGKKIYLSPNWISDVAQLNNVLPREDIQTIYKYYGILLDIDQTLQLRNKNEIMECYDSSIKELISISHKKPKSEVQNMLSKLECLM